MDENVRPHALALDTTPGGRDVWNARLIWSCDMHHISNFEIYQSQNSLSKKIDLLILYKRRSILLQLIFEECAQCVYTGLRDMCNPLGKAVEVPLWPTMYHLISDLMQQRSHASESGCTYWPYAPYCMHCKTVPENLFILGDNLMN
jgi:hypothetical protein